MNEMPDWDDKTELTEQILSRIPSMEHRLKTLQSQIARIKIMAADETVEDVYHRAYRLAYTAETFLIDEVRPFFAAAAAMTFPQRENAEAVEINPFPGSECSASIIGGKWLRLTFPALVPKKRNENTRYIWHTAKSFVTQKVLPFDYPGAVKWTPPPDRATVFYIMHYDQKSGGRMCGDTDNRELKTLQDCLMPNVITFDSVDYLTTFFMGKTGNLDYTEIFVCPFSETEACLDHIENME